MFLAMDCGQPGWRWNPIRIFKVNRWFSGKPGHAHGSCFQQCHDLGGWFLWPVHSTSVRFLYSAMKFGIKFRFVALALVVALMGALIVLATLNSQRQAAELRDRLSQVDLGSGSRINSVTRCAN